MLTARFIRHVVCMICMICVDMYDMYDISGVRGGAAVTVTSVDISYLYSICMYNV